MNLVVGIDNDPVALATYRKNHPHETLEMDLSTTKAVVRALRQRRIELICASPPCQDYSAAGLRVEGARASLTSTLADIVIGTRAVGLIMENVPQMLGSKAFARFERKMLSAGYHLASFVLDASRAGVPQRRKRAIVVATLGPVQPLRNLLLSTEALNSATERTVRQALPEVGDTYLVVSRNAHGPCVVSADRPAPTLRTNCAALVNRDQPRSRDAGSVASATQLSVRQLGILQGFPRSYKWPSTRSRASTVIGNAVPPPLMRWVVRHALPAFEATRETHEDPIHVRAEPVATTGAMKRRALFALGLEQDAELDSDALAASARDAGIQVHRTRPSLVLRYTIGSNKATDLRYAKLTQFAAKRGWMIELRERAVTTSNADDLYWHVRQGSKERVYRSHNELRAAKLII